MKVPKEEEREKGREKKTILTNNGPKHLRFNEKHQSTCPRSPTKDIQDN